MKALHFTLPSTNKVKFNLKDLQGKFVVLYFYPKDDTPGCTIETNDFNKLLSKFNLSLSIPNEDFLDSPIPDE